MKQFLVLALLALCYGPAHADVIRLSEPVQSDESSETFGAPIQKMPSLITLSDALNEADKYSENSFGMEATVSKVCQKKGCFFIAQQGEESIRIAFKDYGFFVPTNITNRKVTVIGRLKQNDVSPEQAEHFSKDLGEKGSVKSGLSYQIIASSVRVPRQAD